MKRAIGVLMACRAAGFDADAQAFITATGITDETIKSAINTLILSWKSYGLWSTKIVAGYPCVGGTADTCKFNIRNPIDSDGAYRLTYPVLPAFASTGITWNGSTTYANTHLVPNTALSLDSSHFFIHSRTAVNYNGGSGIESNPLFELVPRWTDNNTYWGLNEVSDSNDDVGSHAGYFLLSRTGATSTTYYYNGSAVRTSTHVSTSLSTDEIFLGCLNNGGGSTIYFESGEYDFIAIGTGLDATDALNLYNSILTFNTTIGR